MSACTHRGPGLELQLKLLGVVAGNLTWVLGTVSPASNHSFKQDLQTGAQPPVSEATPQIPCSSGIQEKHLW